MITEIIDTNILIYFVLGKPEGKWLLEQLRAGRSSLGISVVTENELFSKPGLQEEEKIFLEECLLHFSKIDVNSTIVRWAALYRSRYRIALADALIAATARYLDVPLVTYNIKDFKNISGLYIQAPVQHGND